MKGTIKSKIKIFFESFVFKLVISIISLYEIVSCITELANGNFENGAIVQIIIWTVLAVHFIPSTIYHIKDREKKIYHK
ncbi:MAG: hypothetical protein PVF17_05615 [Ignavibacteria bacterium]|jgi:hypothetical protein